MLEQAKVKAAGAGLEIEFIEADIRILDLKKKYDLVFIPFNSIHHYIKMKICLKHYVWLKIISKQEAYFVRLF